MASTTASTTATDGNSAFATKLADGNTIPLHGFGTWAGVKDTDVDRTGEAVEAAIRCGYRHIDCAAVYGNETLVGAALAKVIGEGVVKREELFVVSKLWNTCHRKENVRPALEKTLKELGVAYLDLYLVHWPIAFAYPGHLRAITVKDEATGAVQFDSVSIGETWRALEECVDAGLVRSLGVSNFNVQLLAEVLSLARHRPQVNQVELHPYLSQPLLQQFCAKHAVHLTAYSPLGGTVKFPGNPLIMEEPVVLDIAKRLHATPSQVLIRWHLDNRRSVIPKTYNKDRISENFAALNIVLSADDLKQLDGLNRNFRLVDSQQFWGYPVFA